MIEVLMRVNKVKQKEIKFARKNQKTNRFRGDAQCTGTSSIMKEKTPNQEWLFR